MGFIVGIVVSLVIASACSTVARNKHRSSGGWFIAGLIFGFWALLVIALLGDPSEIKYNDGSTEYNRYKYENYD
ncbi:hypothetical protein EZV73_04125 [Acidaminobacter sp. JC074]|uniref:hypothetical protein n=1 Tax=Acidaminobacter sp. JC074 TaxID=2530199 RepID=UPI001F106049|nr:hypothetical protein [Acidaminobacter sp. JC074]MCH4886739.1 hypothetical protein [Acidaminobacter sp. JC074]